MTGTVVDDSSPAAVGEPDGPSPEVGSVDPGAPGGAAGGSGGRGDAEDGGGRRPSKARRRRLQLRLAVGLPLLTAVLSFGIGLYGYLNGRTHAADTFREAIPREQLTSLEAEIQARLLEAPGSYWWLLGLSAFGGLVGLAVAMAFTRQLQTLARRTEELARRGLDSSPVDMQADAEVQPLVAAINDLYQSVQDYARHSVTDGMISIGLDGRVVGINTRAEVAMGVEAEEALGQPYTVLLADTPRNQRAREVIEAALEEVRGFEERRVAWITARNQRLVVDLQGTVLSGDEPVLSVLVVFDKTMDLENIQRQVARAHRLLLIGGFASELAHEIRNPLSSVLGLVDLLRDRLPEGDPGHRHLDVLERAAERIEGLVGQLLQLVPTESQELTPLDVNGVVADAVSMARASRAIDAEIEVEEGYAEDLPEVLLDTERFGRALDNLLRNAFGHTPPGGTVRVTTRPSDGADGAPVGIEVEVANTGSYIPPDERERIFQPFVSGRSRGSGLGLAIAQQIVYAHGGSIRVDSDEREGTSFIIRLPEASEADPSSDAASSQA